VSLPLPASVRTVLQRLRSFRRRPAAGKRLRLQALAVLVAVRTALRILPFKRVKRVLERAGARRATASARASREDVIEAVQAAARHVRRADCLTQALTLRFLLVREGYPAKVHIRVARRADGRLRAHAWVQSGPVTAPCGAADLSGRSDREMPDFDV
jgi:hypothetical protein